MAASTPHETFWLDLIYHSNACKIQDYPYLFWNAFQFLLSKLDTSLERKQMLRSLMDEYNREWDCDQKRKMMGFLEKYLDLNDSHKQEINFSNLHFEREVDFKGAIFNLDVKFFQTHFQKHVSFENARFYTVVNFSDTKFLHCDGTDNLPSTNFSNAEFIHKAEFLGVEFSNIPNFSHVKFKDVKFKDVKFKKNTYFNHTQFNGHTEFIGTEFLGDTNQTVNQDSNKEYFGSCAAYFGNATFSGRVLFENIDIKGEANFKKTEFKGLAGTAYEDYNSPMFLRIIFSHKADFTGSIFPSTVEFSYVKFEKDAIFSNAKFLNETNQCEFTARFENIDFQGEAFFDKTDFHVQAHFSKSDFEQLSYFYKAKFSEDVFFDVNFKDEANFSEANFCSNANFEKTTFHDYATFDDNQGSLRLNLKGATFKKHVPTTFGTKLHEDTSFFNVNWPIARQETAEKHIHSYERLRIQAQGLGMIDSRNNFHRKELECRAVIAVGWDKLWRNAYGLISNHGTSVGRPLFCLLITFFCILTAWDAVYFPYLSDLVGSSTFWDIFGFNFSKVIPFTSMGSYQTDSFKTLIQEAPIFLIFLSSILSIISPILLFLAGLGLRSKFRMSL